VGRNADDRVPAILARRRGRSATYIWAIETVASAQRLELTGQAIAPEGTTQVQVGRGGRSWTLVVRPDAKDVKQRLGIESAP